MKNKNIIIYTITFGSSVSNAAKNLMRGCATQDAYYFHAPSSATLQATFQAIGESLANLRVSK